MKNFVALSIIFSLLALPLGSYAQMNSSSYRMHSDSMNFAGVLSTSTNYQIEDTAGETASGTSTSATYNAYLGYQFMATAPDDEEPTVPSSVTAQVVSSSEIEVTWGVSTDNVGVARYYIYRDGARIDDVATFPRSYSDTGLTAETAYLYNISAIDEAGNESLWSATTSATTTAATVVSSSGGGGSARVVTIDNLQISSNDASAALSFNTSVARIAEIYWGRDLSYSEGSLRGTFSDNHYFVLPNLIPTSFYNVRIVLIDSAGNQTTFEGVSFRTLSVAISQSPANVRLFSASPVESNIALTWRLPADNRVIGARIVRSEESFPAGPQDGEVVLDTDAGRVESFLDTNVVSGVQYYYAIFTEDLAGNLSSGVLATTEIVLPGEEVPINPLDNLLPAGEVDPKIEALRLDDFLFIQSGESVFVRNNNFSIRGEKNTTIALRYYKVPPVLKTIAVTLLTQGANPERFTFILRPNRDQTRYEATIGPLEIDKIYGVRIDILDFKNQGMRTIEGKMTVLPPLTQARSFPELSKELLGFGGAGLFILATLIYISRHSRKKKLPLLNTAQVSQ